MRESARIYDVRMSQFVLKIEKLSHIIGARESRDLRPPSPIMAAGVILCYFPDSGESPESNHAFYEFMIYRNVQYHGDLRQ